MGHLRSAARRRLVPVDMQFQRDDLIEIGLGDSHLPAAVDHARWHVHEDIEGDCLLALGRAEIARQQRSQLVADTLD
ncbi:hypothetical protein D3C87_1985310 [compost metagenome]